MLVPHKMARDGDDLNNWVDERIQKLHLVNKNEDKQKLTSLYKNIVTMYNENININSKHRL